MTGSNFTTAEGMTITSYRASVVPIRDCLGRSDA